MRIALSGWFWTYPNTGSGQYLRCLLKALVEHHPDTTFMLLAPPDRVAGQEIIPGISPIPVPAPRGALGKVWWEQIALPLAVRRSKADLLHVPYWGPPLFSSVPVIATVHDLIPLLLPEYRGSRAVRLYTRLVSLTARRAALLLTDSNASRADILQHLRVTSTRVQAIPLAVDESYSPKGCPEDVELLQALGLEPGYILYLGGFDSRKNLRAVFGAFAKVRREMGGAARLVVAGRLPTHDSAFAPDPRRLMQEAGLEPDAVHFTGFVPESTKPALYRGARAFFFPSRYEGFGLPPLEALACGVPVVGSATSSIPEVVGKAGFLTDPDDIDGMAEALLRLLHEEALRQTLHRCAVEQAAQFSWEKTAQATYTAYRQAKPESSSETFRV